ncbi:MAG: hypothetical protein WD749_00375 [Phycisphaerales bacterium]
MRWLVHLYDRRIVNVNVNIVIAGLMALGITTLVVHYADASGLIQAVVGRVPDVRFTLLGVRVAITGQSLVINGLTLGVDALADIIVYFFLHWFANTMPRKRIPRLRPEYQELTFLRDATLVQFERAVLSPLLYVIALGTQSALLHQGYSVAAATSIGLALGIVTARLLHTMWMLRQERRVGKTSAADIVGPDPKSVAERVHGRRPHGTPSDPGGLPPSASKPAAPRTPLVEPSPKRSPVGTSRSE